MSKQKACKICKTIYEGDKCPECGNQEYTDDIKGRVQIIDAEKSEVANKMKIAKKGLYAIKIK